MEDKIFELIEKMYADLKQDIGFVRGEVQKVGNNVINIEQEHGVKLDALLDGYKQLAEGQKEMRDELADIKEHLAHQENDITFLKAVK